MRAADTRGAAARACEPLAVQRAPMQTPPVGGEDKSSRGSCHSDLDFAPGHAPESSALHKCHLYWVCLPLEIGFCASCGSVVESSQAFSFITRRPPATKSPWPILAIGHGNAADIVRGRRDARRSGTRAAAPCISEDAARSAGGRMAACGMRALQHVGDVPVTLCACPTRLGHCMCLVYV